MNWLTRLRRYVYYTRFFYYRVTIEKSEIPALFSSRIAHTLVDLDAFSYDQGMLRVLKEYGRLLLNINHDAMKLVYLCRTPSRALDVPSPIEVGIGVPIIFGHVFMLYRFMHHIIPHRSASWIPFPFRKVP